ncbi:MAG TPA: hypothetical protein VM282_21590 [Acidimicrobiales bacterium]|nr:hypothetical protein [Acidimicrobiales bacterium]
MTTPTGPGRRKARLIRDEPLAGDALVVLRAAAADRSRTLRNAIADATESGLTYVIVRADGTREVLYGLSVFAQRSDRTVADTLRTFTWAPHFLRFTAGEIRAGGFELFATGANPDHYDIAVLPGRSEHDPTPTPAELLEAVDHLLAIAGQLHPNPAYTAS